jgi:DNA-binding Lrp family transcriptional regulator
MRHELLARPRASGRVHLNDLAEVIGARAIRPEEIEELVDQLEAEGLKVGEDLDDVDVDVMRAVLASARQLQAKLGRRPSVEEIARDAGHEPHEVRRALEHASRRATRLDA